jgi:hypothetical protein
VATHALDTGPDTGPGTGQGQGLAAVETAIRTAMTALGASLLEGLLAVDSGHRGPRIDCGAGHEAGFVAYRGKQIDTVLGPITLRRAWYHCGQCRHGHAPLNTQLGVAGVSLSPGLRSMTDRAGASVPFARAADLLGELAGITLGTKRVERAAEADGAAAAATAVAHARAILTGRVTPLTPAGPVPDMLYLAVDGTGVPMTVAETAARAGKGPDGRARTREAKLACLFTQTRLDENGRPVRDPDSTSYLATLDPVDVFADLVQAAARCRGAETIRQLVVLGDGARWIWNLADQRFPAATQIVDLFHAREHLHALAEHLAFITPDPHTWLTDRLTDLDNGDIEAITAAARVYPLVGVHAEQRDKDLAYFETNAHRMRYAHYRSLGMFVGSGVVEAGCKSVIGQRLKLSGMHWSARGATGITTLRCHHASGRWTHLGAA